MASTDDERRVDEKGRVTIPKEMRERLGIEAGESVSITLREGEVVIKPGIDREEFKEMMAGCINEETAAPGSGDLDPLEVKEMWTEDLPDT